MPTRQFIATDQHGNTHALYHTVEMNPAGGEILQGMQRLTVGAPDGLAVTRIDKGVYEFTDVFEHLIHLTCDDPLAP